jgi:hypothetical protein
VGRRGRTGRLMSVCDRAFGGPARGHGDRRDRGSHKGAPCRGCGAAIEWDGGPRGARPERGVARLRQCPWPCLTRPRPVSAPGVDAGSCALPPGRDAAGTSVCPEARPGPADAGAGLPGGCPRHVGDRRQGLEHRSSIHAACRSVGGRRINTCKLCTTAHRRRSNTFFRTPR